MKNSINVEKDCINQMLDYLVTLKGVPRRVKNKIDVYEVHLIAHIVSAFDRYVVSSSLYNWHRLVNFVSKGKSIII